jgi:hypothetical protein
VPLFESQKARSKRLFREVEDACLQIVWDTPAIRADQGFFPVFNAILVGGNVAADIAVAACKDLERAFAKRHTREAALGLMGVFAIPILFRYNRAQSEDKRPTGSEVIATMIQWFGLSTPVTVENYFKVSQQYTWEQDRFEATGKAVTVSKEAMMIQSLALGILRIETGLQWPSLNPPIEDSEVFFQAGARLEFFTQPTNLLALPIALSSGTQAMWKAYKEWIPEAYEYKDGVWTQRGTRAE